MSNSRRSSLGGSSQDLRVRVTECLNRLADRDTLSIATAELDGIARALSDDSFSVFLSCLHGTEPSARAPVRKHCASLLAVMSHSHGDSLSPFLSRMVSTLLRRLRDPDTAVRSACVDAAAAMAARITLPPFSAAFLKPLVDAMATEQGAGAQAGAAMCLSAAIEASPAPEPLELRRSLPRLGRLAKSDGFKAKSAIVAVIGSVVGAGGASSVSVLDWLVPGVVEFLGSEDWAVRKAAAEALARVAALESGFAERYRDLCLIALQNRRFDKIKVVRETMNHTLELWKEVSSGITSSEEFPSPTQSRSSTSTDNGIGRCLPPLSKSYQESSFKTPRAKKPTVPTNRSPQTDSDKSSRNRVTKVSPITTVSSKLDQPKKKPSSLNWKIEIAVAGGDNNQGEINKPFGQHGAKTEKGYRFGGLRVGSRVVPFDDDYDDGEYKQGLDCIDRNVAEEEALESHKDAEDLCLIREQLLQIENQQSSLFDLLQRFIGSSQNGLSSLETRVNGIESALEEMSYNMAVSSGRISGTESSAENTCCILPGADFLSSKFRRRAENRHSSMNRDCGSEVYKLENRRFQHRNGGAFQLNSRNFPNRFSKNNDQDSGTMNACSDNGCSGA